MRAVCEEGSSLVWCEGCHVSYYKKKYFKSKTELIGYYNLKLDQGFYYFIGDQYQFTLQAILFQNQMLHMVTNML